jgi:hypothetical protein
LNRTIALTVGWAACVCTAGAFALAVACIPDLPAPADQPPDADDEPTTCGDGITQLGQHEQCDPGVDIAPDSSYQFCSSNCTVDCPTNGFVWSKNNHCYQAPTKAASYDLAVSACSLLGGGTHLATFASEEELQATLSYFAAREVRGPFWIGLTSKYSPTADDYTEPIPNEPGWSPTCTGCFAHGAPLGAPLSTPDSGVGADGQCIEGFFGSDASWQKYSCDGGRIWALCEREPHGTTVAPCEGGLCLDIPFTYPDKHYLYVGRPSNADGASQYCAAHGGSLVVLQSRDEREQLWYELAHGIALPNSSLTIWIGLSSVDGGWIWDDDAGVNDYPPPWADTYPLPTPEGGSRAALVQSSVNPQPFDTTLAQNGIDTDEVNPFLCQLLPQTDAGDGGEAAAEGGDAGDAAESGADGGTE